MDFVKRFPNGWCTFTLTVSIISELDVSMMESDCKSDVSIISELDVTDVSIVSELDVSIICS